MKTLRSTASRSLRDQTQALLPQRSSNSAERIGKILVKSAAVITAALNKMIGKIIFEEMSDGSILENPIRKDGEIVGADKRTYKNPDYENSGDIYSIVDINPIFKQGQVVSSELRIEKRLGTFRQFDSVPKNKEKVGRFQLNNTEFISPQMSNGKVVSYEEYRFNTSGSVLFNT